MKNIRGSLILSIGFVLSSIIFSGAFVYVRSLGAQCISVKGLAEREVDATIGIWDIRFETAGEDLNQVNVQIKQQTDTVVSFLREQGFIDQHIVYGIPQLKDNAQYNTQQDKKLRYIEEMQLTVHTSDVSLLWAAVQKSQELLKKGVQLKMHWRDPVKFEFTELNKIKVAMLQEATINARTAAEQLAADAHIQLGSLRTATQGTFSISDTHIPTKKHVRIVTYVNYAIK
ncbi:SIMPL domain-containing protein [Candidatus Cardinium hertigii]|jgi:hypothetical protein|uniref:SIMPL domain-containing protein n=1 Tax=Candidatus Cardinium hertigii TaxID=247481 RepID=A0A3N2QC53_9BACT|nr:SIMPL domain-containing protein [Candidatus Cardinium hertigii]ROT47403.1 SIMPL domain-containing protein [Candidatus Cardinium hertigii]